MRLLLSISLIFLLSTTIYSQSYYSGIPFKPSSLDEATSARSIALGETSVADPYNTTSFIFNPAALFNNTGVDLSFSNRSDGWNSGLKDRHYYSFAFSYNNGIGFVYNRFHSGTLTFPGSESKSYNTTIGFYFARSIFHNLNAGIGVKTFSKNTEQTGDYAFQYENKLNILVDAGLFYKYSLPGTDRFNHAINLGLSAQNFGNDYKEKMKDSDEDYYIIKLPRYLMMGFSYSASIKDFRHKPMIDILLTGEYKDLLNPANSDKANSDYYGIGCELKFIDMIALRVGWVNSPEDNVLFDRKKFKANYGGGINLALSRFGSRIPIVLNFDYTLIPVNQITIINFDGGSEQSKSKLSAFSLGLKYLFNQ